jgi:hypothetical protein
MHPVTANLGKRITDAATNTITAGFEHTIAHYILCVLRYRRVRKKTQDDSPKTIQRTMKSQANPSGKVITCASKMRVPSATKMRVCFPEACLKICCHLSFNPPTFMPDWVLNQPTTVHSISFHWVMQSHC